MTKADLVDAICEQAGLIKKDASDALEEVLSIIKETLEAEQEVKVSGFGRFQIKSKLERRGRNPQICTSSARNGQAKSAELKGFRERRSVHLSPHKWTIS